MTRPGVRQGLVWTGLGSASTLLFLFLETAVGARLLPTEEYGAYVLLLAIVNFGLMVVDFGCKSAATQMIASGDPDRQSTVAHTALAFRALTIVATALLAGAGTGYPLGGVGPLVARLAGDMGGAAQYLAYVPLMLAVASLDELLGAILQGFGAYRPVAIAQALRGAARLGLTVVLLSRFQLGVMALVWAWAISFALSSAYQYWRLPIRRCLVWDGALLREMLRFGMPLQLTRVLWFASGRVHVLLLGALAGPVAVAFYAVAARIPDALQQLSDAYMRVYFPTVTSLLARGESARAERMLNQSLRLIALAGALAAVGAVVFSREIVTLIFSEKYAASSWSFALLMVGFHMTTIVNLMGYTLTAAGRPERSLCVDVVRTAVNVVGDLLLIPVLGVGGAAGAAVAASYAGNPPVAWFLHRARVTPQVGVYAKQVAIALLAVGLTWWLDPSALIEKAALAALLGGLAGFSAIERSDLALLLPGRRAAEPAIQS